MYEITRSRPLQVLLAVNFIQGLAMGFGGFFSYLLLDLGGSAVDLGLFSLLPGLVSTLMQLAWGRVADRVPNSQRLAVYGYLATAVLCLPSVFAGNPQMIIGAWMLQALFASVLQVVNFLVLTKYIDPKHRAGFMGIYNPLSYLGNIAGSFIAGILIPVAGYQATLSLYSVLYFALAGMVWWFLPGTRDACEESFWGLMRDGIRELPAGLRSLPQVMGGGGTYTRWVIAIAVRGFGLALFQPVLTFYVGRILDAPKPLIGSLTSLSFIVRLVASPILGAVADRWGAKPVMLGGVVVAALHPFLLTSFGSLETLPLIYAVSGVYWACINASWIAWQMNLIPRSRGVYSGLLNFVNGLEWAVAPMVGGELTQSFPLVYSAGMSALFLMIGFLLLLRVPEKE